MTYPKISIITPSYNQGHFLEECIQSILDQQYPNLEYMIIDGGSTDQSPEIIKKYAPYLKYWVIEPDQGQSDAINKGLKHCEGEIINWLNADDFYEPRALFTVAESFQNPQVKVVCGECKVVKNPRINSHISPGTDIYPGNLAKTIGWARTDQPATFYHQSAIERMGQLDTSLHYLMDRDWWIKYLFHFGLENIAIIDKVLVNFRHHQQSKTISQKERFQLDRDSYYVAMSNLHGLKEQSNFLEHNSLIIKDYKIKNLPLQNTRLIKCILNYYFLLKADEYYAQNQNYKAQIYLDFLNQELLTGEDLRLWKKIYWRNKYLPQLIIRLLRKIKKLLPLTANL